MEKKVRKESQTLMEKTFNRYEEHGHVTKKNISEMLKQMNPEVELNEDLDEMIANQDKSGSGLIDWPGFNQIVVHFLLKQAKQDHDQFIHKHELGPKDFEDE